MPYQIRIDSPIPKGDFETVALKLSSLSRDAYSEIVNSLNKGGFR